MTLTPRAAVLHDLLASARAQGSTIGCVVESAMRVFLDSPAGADVVAEGIAADCSDVDTAARAMALATLPLADLLAALEARGAGEA